LIKNVAPYTGDRGIGNYLYHYAPNISLVPAVNPILGTGKFVQWQIQFSNQGGTVSPNSWLTFSVADTTQIKFTSLSGYYRGSGYLDSNTWGALSNW
jgi:hypothetical protein